MRNTLVFISLLVLLAVLGVSLMLGTSKTRAYAGALLNGNEATATSAPGASGSAPSTSALASLSTPLPSASAPSTEVKPEGDRSLAVMGLGWDLLAPGLLAAEGMKSTATSAFATANVRVSLAAANAMGDVERALASGGAASGGADIAVVPLSEFVTAYERLRALDLRVFFVPGWSQGRDTLLGTSLAKLPGSGPIEVEAADGNADALALALLTLDLAGTALERLKIDQHLSNALLQAKGGNLLEQDAAKQQEVVLSTREAARLLPYVLLAPRPVLEERESVVVSFLQGWLLGTDTLLKDRAKAARSLAALEGAPEALNLLHALGDWEPIRLHENTELLGLAGRGAISIEALIDWQFRARRAAHLGRASTPDVSLVDGRIVTRLVRSNPKLVLPAEPQKRKSAAASAIALLERTFTKDDEEPIIDAIGLLAAVFPRHDLRVSLSGKAAKAGAQWLDRAATRYDVDRGRLLLGTAPIKAGRLAVLEVLRAP